MTEFIKKHAETIKYLIAGILAVAVNTATFLLLVSLHMERIASNTVAFFLTVLFAYWTNSTFVFCTPHTWKRFLQFFGMRIGTILIDDGGMYLLQKLAVSDFAAKCIVNFVVIGINYLLSKLIIFRRGN